MTKFYKDYEIINLGYSDIANVTIRYCIATEFGADYKGIQYQNIKFGADGSYEAYLVDEGAEIGAHYKEVINVVGGGWLEIIDDVKKRFNCRFKKGFKVFRAGNYGCIIQILGGEK